MEQKASVESFGYKQEFKRTLKVRDLVFFGLVAMAPVASMTLFGIMFMISGGHNFLSYVIGATALLFTALSYGKMVQAFPIAGSTYSYTQRAIHPWLGFLAGWVMLIDYLVFPMLLYVVSANYAAMLVPWIPFWGWVLIYLIPVTIINLFGIELAAKVNFVTGAFMILAVIAFVIAGVNYALTGGATMGLFSAKAIFNPATFTAGGLLAGSVLGVCSYLGFDGITTLSEEADETPRKINNAIIIAVVIETILYLLVAYFGSLAAFDFKAFANPDTAFFDIAIKVGGTAFQIFVTLVIAISGAPTALTGQAAASRLLYGMGRDKLIPPKIFAYLHPKYKTATYSILFMGVLGLIGALTISMQTLSEMITFGALFGFICVNLSVINHYLIRKKSGRYIVHGLLPLLGTIVCGFVEYGMSPLAKTVGFTWLGVGIIYLVIRSLASKDFQSLLENNSMITPDM